jgi:YVTN family beta-propeller protein
VIDTATNVVLGSAIPVGWNPQALTVSPNGVHVYVSNFNSHDISVIETVSGTVSATIPVGFFPFGMAMTPDGTRLYVADSDPQANNGSVAVIDTAINSVITRVTLPMFHTSRRIAVTPDGTRGYIAINTPQEVLVFDTSSNLLVGGPIPIDGIPEGIAITPSAQDSVLFSALTATVKVRRNHPYGFVANGTFALGEGHNGISPAIEDTQVSIVDATGTVLFVETLPNGSFKGTSHGGVVLYTSNPTGSIAAMLIKSNHKRNVHRVQLRVRSSAIVPWSPLPLTLSLQIGNDSGSVELRCEQDASFWVCH